RWLRERRVALEQAFVRGTYLDEGDVRRFLELSFPGVDELVGLLELERLANASAPRTVFDVVVVDTAPQGHTLRLLRMPETLGRLAAVLDGLAGKHRVLVEALGGSRRPDAVDRLVAELAEDGRRLAALLRDPERTAFRWVLLPEDLALAEAEDGVAALEREGFGVSGLVVNRVTPPPRGACALCRG